MSDYRPEYSSLARLGNWLWTRATDPILRAFADDELVLLRRLRLVIQLVVLTALVMLPLSLFFNAGHMITGSGLLFDVAGALRLFLHETISTELAGFKENEYGNVPSVAMRELIMPEASGPYDMNSNQMSLFYYQKRAILYLFIGFVLQLIGSFVG